CSTSTHESAPAMTAQMVRAMMSHSWCRRPCSRRGSCRSAKHWRSETVLVLVITLLLREADRSEKNLSFVQLSKTRAPRRMSLVRVVRLPCNVAVMYQSPESVIRYHASELSTACVVPV